MTPLQARLARAQLDQVEADWLIRLAHARRYHEGLSDLPEIQLPPLVEDGSHSYLSYPIQVEARTALVRHMMRRRRDVRAQYYRNLADLPCFEAYFRDCPVARSVAAQVLLLPVYPGYRRSEVEKNIEALRSFFSPSRPGRA
jgi:dTDP-4-amino-4,6-dideoxygalactose transaminase